MKMEEYQQQALKTESPITPELQARACNVNNIRLLHGAMGICTEVAELQNATDHVNVIEELGDIEWYMAVMRDVLVLTQKQIQDVEIDPPRGDRMIITEMVVAAGYLLDIVKKTIFYGKTLDSDMLGRGLATMELLLLRVRYVEGTSLEHVQDRNIEKLVEKRYKNKGYSHESALNRDLNEERKVLEEPMLGKVPKYWESVLDARSRHGCGGAAPGQSSPMLTSNEIRILQTAIREKYDGYERPLENIDVLKSKLELALEIADIRESRYKISNEPEPGAISGSGKPATTTD